MGIRTFVDVQMIGATGRLFLSGRRRCSERAWKRIDEVLGSVIGREIGKR